MLLRIRILICEFSTASRAARFLWRGGGGLGSSGMHWNLCKYPKPFLGYSGVEGVGGLRLQGARAWLQALATRTLKTSCQELSPHYPDPKAYTVLGPEHVRVLMITVHHYIRGNSDTSASPAFSLSLSLSLSVSLSLTTTPKPPTPAPKAQNLKPKPLTALGLGFRV